jgi:hypothetical protein
MGEDSGRKYWQRYQTAANGDRTDQPAKEQALRAPDASCRMQPVRELRI